MTKNIAIDGPAGAGKSTIARRIAKEMGFIYVDTGALYRAVGLFMLNQQIDTKEAEKVSSLLKDIKVEIKFINHEQRVFLNDADVSEDIRKPEASMAASDVSAIPSVRDFLFGLQKDIARKNNVIMDGRDIGTVVLPNADLKIFLTASPENRAQRRYDELIAKGFEVQYDTLLEEIRQRDYNDSHREIAPLKQAEDAILVDTTGNELEQSVQILMDVIKENLI
ncbi:MAG: cmk [Oscillospiraceae bacterium]|nr:cmk [Oscillospiraceae bacterium]